MDSSTSLTFKKFHVTDISTTRRGRGRGEGGSSETERRDFRRRPYAGFEASGLSVRSGIMSPDANNVPLY